MFDSLMDVVRTIVVALLILIFVYCLVRGASFAYFRSRYEHYRMLQRLKRLKSEDKTNGQV